MPDSEDTIVNTKVRAPVHSGIMKDVPPTPVEGRAQKCRVDPNLGSKLDQFRCLVAAQMRG